MPLSDLDELKMAIAEVDRLPPYARIAAFREVVRILLTVIDGQNSKLDRLRREVDAILEVERGGRPAGRHGA